MSNSINSIISSFNLIDSSNETNNDKEEPKKEKTNDKTDSNKENDILAKKTTKPAKTTKKKKKQEEIASLLTKDVLNPILVSVSEAAKIGGIKPKTIRRALQAKAIKYVIVKNRYKIDLSSVIIYLHSKTKLKNKLNQRGIGQYIDKWRE